MATRVVMHLENLNEVPVAELLRDLAEDVADDGQRRAPRRTGALSLSVHVGEVDDDHAVVVADVAREQEGGPEHYAYWVEKGTSDTKAQPFLTPALLRYRTR